MGRASGVAAAEPEADDRGSAVPAAECPVADDWPASAGCPSDRRAAPEWVGALMQEMSVSVHSATPSGVSARSGERRGSRALAAGRREAGLVICPLTARIRHLECPGTE